MAATKEKTTIKNDVSVNPNAIKGQNRSTRFYLKEKITPPENVTTKKPITKMPS